MRRVGICVPGGAASYPSTLLMTVCPARAAEVPELAVVMPPTPAGAYNHDLLAVCHELGVTEVYRVGGAQAVAALAYGVQLGRTEPPREEPGDEPPLAKPAERQEPLRGQWTLVSREQDGKKQEYPQGAGVTLAFAEWLPAASNASTASV